MNTILRLTTVIITTLASSSLLADNIGTKVNMDEEYNNPYVEEIEAYCKTEAAGLPEADDYIKDCIETNTGSSSQ